MKKLFLRLNAPQNDGPIYKGLCCDLSYTTRVSIFVKVIIQSRERYHARAMSVKFILSSSSRRLLLIIIYS